MIVWEPRGHSASKCWSEPSRQEPQAAEDRRAGQLGLFGALMGGAPISRLRPSPALRSNFPGTGLELEKQKTAYEKEVLGFYISGHPLSPFGEIIKRYCSHDTIAALKAADRTTVVLAGIISNLRFGRTRTQRGKWC